MTFGLLILEWAHLLDLVGDSFAENIQAQMEDNVGSSAPMPSKADHVALTNANQRDLFDLARRCDTVIVETEAQMTDFKNDVRNDIAELRSQADAQLKQMAEFHADHSSNMAEFQATQSSNMADFQANQSSNMAELQAMLRAALQSQQQRQRCLHLWL